MCEAYNLQYGTNFISIAPSNIYGDAGEFDLDKARVQYALLHKIHLAKLFNEDAYELLQKDFKNKQSRRNRKISYNSWD